MKFYDYHPKFRFFRFNYTFLSHIIRTNKQDINFCDFPVFKAICKPLVNLNST